MKRGKMMIMNQNKSTINLTRLIFLLTIFVFVFDKSAYSENLPEFFGCYIQNEQGNILELAQNKSIGSTGWFVKQRPSSTGNALLDIQKKLETGGDLGAALSAASNTKYFLTDFSGKSISTNDLKGFILYGDFKIDEVKLYKLSNKLIPNDANFVEYHGPKPIDKDKMWFPSGIVEFRSKPLQDNMHFIKTRNLLTCGNYLFNIGDKFYDFKVSQLSNQNPIIGVYDSIVYREEKGIFGNTYVHSKEEIHILDIDNDGLASGIVKKIDINTSKVIDEEEFNKTVKINLKNKKITIATPDKNKEGHVYGVLEGNIFFDNSGECDSGHVKIKVAFLPYEKYKETEFIKKFALSGVWTKR